ncbi:MAG TPA: hypothetical protein DC054_04750 [Blastocatellia bacterium]|nr:hypothetical protein [Blastocatellia bacterium]
MKKAAQSLLLAFLILLPFGCNVQTVTHDPVKAVSDTNGFLKALYLEENYPKALSLADVQLRQSVTADDLREIVAGIKQRCGSLKTLRADSYLMTPGSTMELFYVGTYETGTLYHRLVLVGDVSSGYRVAGVWYQAEDYQEQPLRRKFDQDLLVK